MIKKFWLKIKTFKSYFIKNINDKRLKNERTMAYLDAFFEKNYL